MRALQLCWMVNENAGASIAQSFGNSCKTSDLRRAKWKTIKNLTMMSITENRRIAEDPYVDSTIVLPILLKEWYEKLGFCKR